MAALGLGCCAWTFSGGGELGLLSGGGGELGLLSGCGARASLAAAPSSWFQGGVFRSQLIYIKIPH